MLITKLTFLQLKYIINWNLNFLDATVKETIGIEVKKSKKIATVQQPLKSPQLTRDTNYHIEANCKFQNK